MKVLVFKTPTLLIENQDHLGNNANRRIHDDNPQNSFLNNSYILYLTLRGFWLQALREILIS